MGTYISSDEAADPMSMGSYISTKEAADPMSMGSYISTKEAANPMSMGSCISTKEAVKVSWAEKDKKEARRGKSRANCSGTAQAALTNEETDELNVIMLVQMSHVAKCWCSARCDP